MFIVVFVMGIKEQVTPISNPWILPNFDTEMKPGSQSSVVLQATILSLSCFV